jgi:hypothetical protein
MKVFKLKHKKQNSVDVSKGVIMDNENFTDNGKSRGLSRKAASRYDRASIEEDDVYCEEESTI